MSNITERLSHSTYQQTVRFDGQVLAYRDRNGDWRVNEGPPDEVVHAARAAIWSVANNADASEVRLTIGNALLNATR